MPVVSDLKAFDPRSGNLLERLVFNNRMLVDACIPYDMKLKGTFPTVVDVSGELRAKLKAKFPHIFPPM